MQQEPTLDHLKQKQERLVPVERPLLELKIRQLFERALVSKEPLPMGYFSTVVNTRNGWFGWAVRRSRLTRGYDRSHAAPDVTVPLLRKGKAEHRYLTVREIDRLLLAARAKPEVSLMINVLLFTELRPREAKGHKVKDFMTAALTYSGFPCYCHGY